MNHLRIKASTKDIEVGIMLKKTSNGVIININVKPQSKNFEVKLSESEITIFCKSPPIGGKANREVMKELSKIFKHKVIIIAGYKKNTKIILVEGITLESARSALEDLNRSNYFCADPLPLIF